MLGCSVQVAELFIFPSSFFLPQPQTLSRASTRAAKNSLPLFHSPQQNRRKEVIQMPVNELEERLWPTNLDLKELKEEIWVTKENIRLLKEAKKDCMCDTYPGALRPHYHKLIYFDSESGDEYFEEDEDKHHRLIERLGRELRQLEEELKKRGEL
jgi:hypothetical protein